MMMKRSALSKKCGKGNSVIADHSCNTGYGVTDAGNGVFDACGIRTSLCGYACCSFGTLGNFIAALPNEVEEARELGLQFDHLQIQDQHHDGSCTLACSRPCVQGDFKPIDCMIYPLFPMNESCTKFIVADHRKCPIPDRDLLEHAFWVQEVCRRREETLPGTVKSMMAHGLDFKGYQPFPYEVYGRNVDGEIMHRRLDRNEMAEITPHETLSDAHVIDWPLARTIRACHEQGQHAEDALWSAIHLLDARTADVIRAGMRTNDTLTDWLGRYTGTSTPEDHHDQSH